jgi:tetratricopeptide (TPR) repeat protein
MSNNSPGFWKELKRRGVPKVLAMYAATAFILMEAADIMLPRLGLPDWTVTLVIVLLIVGLPVVFVLSWVFDITPQGVVKTAAAEEVEESERSDVKQRRKLRISDVVIVVLFAAVVMLIYPKIFGSNEAGPNRGEISIAVMPFKNLTGDTLYNIWQGGLQNLLITSLSNSEQLSVRQYETMFNVLGKNAGVNYASLTPTMAGNAARKLDANTVIIGNMYKSEDRIRVTSNIMNPDTEEIFRSFELQGVSEDDFFVLADSLSQIIKDYLEIKSMKNEVYFEMKSVYTESPEAYKLYITGQNYYSFLNYPMAIENFRKALEIDSTFVSAMVQLAYCYGDTQQAGLAKEWAYKAYDQMDRLPHDMQFLVNILISSMEKKPMDQVHYLDLYLTIHPQAMIKYYQLGRIKFNMEKWEEAIDAFERSLELAEKHETETWVWTYSMLGNAYHNAGMHKKEEDIFNTGREIWPQQKARFDYWQAVCAISRGDTAKANIYMDGIREMTQEAGWPEANLWLWYAGIYNWAEDDEQAEYYYRKAHALRPENPVLLGEFALFLIEREINVEEGMEYITALVEDHPDQATYLYAYGLGLYKKGKFQEASEALQRAWDARAYYDHKHFTLMNDVKDILDRG